MSLISLNGIYIGTQTLGKQAGYPTVFISLDKDDPDGLILPEKKGRNRPLSVRAIETQLFKYRTYRRFCFCGGEPLEQKDNIIPLVYCYNKYGNIITIKTNNTIDIDEDIGYKRNHNYMLSIQCPSTGRAKENYWKNFEQLQYNDELLFNIYNTDDLAFVKKVLTNRSFKAETVSITARGEEINKNDINTYILKEGWNAKVNALEYYKELPCLKKKK